MSNIYLSRLGLSCFRTYVDPVEITLPAEPSLTVIVGPNGLGKSTLFDAMEWGLTGDLKRIKTIAAPNAERKQCIGKRPSVDLWFSDNTHVHRTESSVFVNDASGEKKVADWLAHPKWRGMNNIADCLQLTHFLGQSTRQLFVHQEGAERWNRLEGPAGLQTLWSIEQTLGRNKTSSAFNSLDAELRQKLAQLYELRDGATRIGADLQRQRAIARAGSVLSVQEVIEGCLSIEKALGNLNVVVVTGYSNIDLRLQKQQESIEEAKQLITAEKTRLEEWKTISPEYSLLCIKAEEYLADLAKVKEAYAIAASALEAAVNHEKALQESSVSALRKIEEFRHHVGEIRSNLQWRQEKREVESHIIKTEAALHLLNKKIEDIRKAIASCHENLQIIVGRRRRYEEINAHKRTLGGIQSNHQTYMQALAGYQDAVQGVQQMETDEQQFLLAQTAAIEALQQKNLEVDALNTKWAQSKAAATAVSAAIAQIASALSEDDCACPVCLSSFQEKGRLKSLAWQQAQASNSQLAVVEIERNSAIKEQQQLHVALRTIENQLKGIAEQRGSLASAAEHLSHLEENLRAFPLLSTLLTEQFGNAIHVAMLAADNDVKSVAAEIGASRPEVDVLNEIKRLETDEIATATERTNTLANITVKKAELSALTLQLEKLSFKDGNMLSEELGNLIAELGQAEKTLQEKQSEIENAKMSTALQHKGLEEINRDISTLEQQLRESMASRNLLLQRWLAAGYTGAPTPSAVTQAITAHNDRHNRLEEIKRSHAELVEGRTNALNQETLNRLENDVGALLLKYQVADHAELLNLIDKKIEKLTAEQTILSEVSAKRNEVIRTIKTRNNDIRSGVSAPLNATVAKFCSALMTDRNFQVSVNAIANAASAQALLSFQLENGDGDPKKNPLLYMSEGQLAAVSLCLLFGASTTYPWSRWKALLLDDPLHHNDSIHSAAFIDVVRNLITKQSYQIVVSTHDMEQAGYFLRKCANAGIATRYWHLYGRDETGKVLMQRDHASV